MPPPSPNRDQPDQRLRATIDSIPAGKVASYGQIAAEAGLPGRARRVGWILRRLPAGSSLPWHRVVNAAGRSSLPHKSAVWREQRRRLDAEGVEMDARGRVDLRRFLWHP